MNEYDIQQNQNCYFTKKASFHSGNEHLFFDIKTAKFIFDYFSTNVSHNIANSRNNNFFPRNPLLI